MTEGGEKQLIVDGWFREMLDDIPGKATMLKVNHVLYSQRSDFQDILVFESTNYGNVLVLDGAIQCTERDEFSYQEMITHLALVAHPNPQNVLVIGGGDGGCLREVFKHSCVEQATLCEIDKDVIEVSRRFLPSMALGLNHPKLKLHIGDGAEFVKQHKKEFDVIIVDSTDPEGPGGVLFTKNFLADVAEALTDNGIFINQCESIWNELDLIKKVINSCQKLFPVVRYAWTSTPTYPSGQIGFAVSCKDNNADPTKPARLWPPEEQRGNCRYYNAQVHQAAFTLPLFAQKIFEE